MVFELVLIILILIFVYLKWHYSYWSRRNVDGPKPMPLFGNLYDFIAFNRHFGSIFSEIYKKYSNAKYVGFYKLHKPAILIRDIDLVQKVLVNDFTSFIDNDFHINESLDRFQSVSPFVTNGLNGNKWRVTRKNVVPVFAASKIKAILPNLIDVGDRLVKYIESGHKHNPDGFEAKLLCTQYAIENLATAGFGNEGDTFKNPNSEFYQKTSNIFEPTGMHFVRILTVLFLPILGKLFRISFVPPSSEKWIVDFIKSIKKYREENNINRDDLIQYFLRLHDKKLINERFLYGYGVLICVEGYETSASVMSNMLFEMCVNPDIQKKVRDELIQVREKYGNELTYEALNELTYMDMVFNETLRKHSPTLTLPKICTKQYELPPQYGTGKSVIIEPGTPILIPLQAIHEDPAYYANPFEFNPERFSEENKKLRNKYTFLAFGEGPRICVGMRFAMVQVKIGIASLLMNYEVSLSPRTVLPLKIAAKTFLLATEGGIWIKFKKIK